MAETRANEERIATGSRIDKALAASAASDARYELAQEIIRHERTATLEALREVDHLRRRASEAADHAEVQRGIARRAEANVARHETTLRALCQERAVMRATLTVAERRRHDLEKALHQAKADHDEAMAALRVERTAARNAREDVARLRLAVVQAERSAVHRAAQLTSIRTFLPLAPHFVHHVPGVHDHEVRGLRRFGVNTCDALLHSDIVALAEATDIGLPRLAKLRALAELMTLDGLDAAVADHAFRAGARSVGDVAAMGFEKLEVVLRAAGLNEAQIRERVVSIAFAAREALHMDAGPSGS